jgi:effector-binding domain-containing protein
MKKNILMVIGVVFILFMGWYFLIKSADYTITFNVKAATGPVFQGIEEWSTAQTKSNQENYEVVEKKNYELIRQKISKGNNQLEYTWNIKSLNDSTTKVVIDIKDHKNSWYNKLTVPFMETPFKQSQIKRIKEFKTGLEDHLKLFKVKLDGEGETAPVYVAYISLKSVMQQKAQTMIANDGIITGYLHNNNIKIIGKPYAEITRWDRDKELVEFNYCFPVSKEAIVVPHQQVKFKTIEPIKGLKATYFGNFRTSDRAWFALLDHAKRNGIELENRVLENFLANPFNGGNELEWETKVIIPFSAN